MTKFSDKFKKPCFWPIFPIFAAKRFPALSHITRHRPPKLCGVSEKTNELIPRKLTDRRTERQKDKRTERWKDRP